MKKIIYFFVLLVTFLPKSGFGQCAPPAPSCSGCVALSVGNQTLSSGTYCITTAISNLTIPSGAVVCMSGGSLTNSNLNGGTLLYTAGSLSNLNSNSGDIRVQGTLSNPSNTSFNNVRVIVENGGVLNMTSLDINSSLVVDGGTVNVTNLTRVNSSGSICLANMGQIHTQYFQNNGTNRTTAQTTKGCLSISQPQNGQTFLNNPLTTSSDVLVCLPGTFTPSNLGSATVTNNCTGCTTAMPVTYAYFRAQPLETGVLLEWQTTNELNHRYFIVERSRNALDFLPISGEVIDPFGTQNGRKVYRYTDFGTLPETYYYRLKQIDADGTVAYSKILSVILGDQNTAVRLFPNPVVSQLTIGFETAETGIIDIEVADLSGKQWLSQRGNKTEKSHSQTLQVQSLPKGLYLVTIRLGNQFFIRRVLK